MLSLIKTGSVLIMVLLLVGLFTTTAFAQCPPGAKIYYDTINGDDVTGNGKQDNPFKTYRKAKQVSLSCTIAGEIYENGIYVDDFSPSIPPPTGTPIVETLFVGGLIILAILSIGAALIIGRRSSAVPS